MTLRLFTMRRSPTLLCIFVLTLGFVLASCQTDNDGSISSTRYSASEEFSFQIEIANRTLLRVYAIDGSVEVVGTANLDSVRIWGERTVKSESVEDAEEHLPDLSVYVEPGDDEIVVRTTQIRPTSGRDYEVTYYIRVPDTWTVSVTESNGTVSVASIHDSVAIGLSNGTAVVDSTYGDVDVSLANGTIDGRVFLPVMGTCVMGVANGQINLSIPESTSAEFSASVSNGEITVSNLPLQDMTSTPTSVTGTLGNGEGQINLSVANGTIVAVGF